MSKQTTTDNPTVITVATEPEETQEAVVKQSIAARGWNFVKTHKKGAFAALGLVALVGVAAAAGRSSASTPDFETLELESPSEDDEAVVESLDIVNA